MNSGSMKSKEADMAGALWAWGDVVDDETRAIDGMGSQRALGPKSEIGVLFYEQQEATGGFGAVSRSPLHFTPISLDVFRGEAGGGQRRAQVGELGSYGMSLGCEMKVTWARMLAEQVVRS